MCAGYAGTRSLDYDKRDCVLVHERTLLCDATTGHALGG